MATDECLISLDTTILRGSRHVVDNSGWCAPVPAGIYEWCNAPLCFVSEKDSNCHYFCVACAVGETVTSCR